VSKIPKRRSSQSRPRCFIAGANDLVRNRGRLRWKREPDSAYRTPGATPVETCGRLVEASPSVRPGVLEVDDPFITARLTEGIASPESGAFGVRRASSVVSRRLCIYVHAEKLPLGLRTDASPWVATCETT
jgi:hypothetical protein